MQLEKGGQALLLADVELRRDVSALTEQVESAEARVTASEAEYRPRIANLEIEIGQHATTMQTLYDAVDSKLSEMETRIESRLDYNERNSGVQTLFARVEEITRMADQRFQEVSGQMLTLASTGPAQGSAPSDNALVSVVTALQREVDDLRVEVHRALSTAEGAHKVLSSKVDSSNFQEVHDRVTSASNEAREASKKP